MTACIPSWRYLTQVHIQLTFAVGIDSDWVFSGEKETRDGQDYLKLTKLFTKINNDSPKKVELHFDGLFGGNKVLGASTAPQCFVKIMV